MILQSGDILKIESRETELYYTGGLLPVGEFVLPRDYDLDVIEAVAQVRGPFLNGSVNQASQFYYIKNFQNITDKQWEDYSTTGIRMKKQILRE